MKQEAAPQEAPLQIQGGEQHQDGSRLGPLLCWAVVFADVGTSIYYVPGILYGNVGNLAGFFVMLTMSVFVLLTLKYAEVTHRFPHGGGVVTVAAQAINHWVGALGGMFILVDYFLTAAISCLSGMLYLSVVMPALVPFTLEMSIGVLLLLGLLNWFGVSESAKVSLVGALIAFLSDIALLVTVFTHLSFTQFLALFPYMFAHQKLTFPSLLVGFAGSFLAFSGLESISQLSPVMKTPRKKVAGIALLLVVLTIGLTSPLLTMFATLLLPPQVVGNQVLSAQVISLLGGHWGNIVLQTEVAISASALLIFAGNTAIIGSYHVFLALSRMEFFPAFVQQRNKLRGTPHFSILLAIAIPISVLIAVHGALTVLGDLYAFGLLGAFTLTCVGLDIVRRRERKAARAERASYQSTIKTLPRNEDAATASETLKGTISTTQASASSLEETDARRLPGEERAPSPYTGRMALDLWHTCKFYLGLLTTALVALAWTTNLVAKPLATIFGGSVTMLGMGVAYFNYARKKQQGFVAVPITHVEERLPGSTLAVLMADNTHNEAVIRSAIHNANGKPVTFLYLGHATTQQAPRLFEFHNPYYDDKQARRTFSIAEHLAQKAKIARRYVYRQQEPATLERIWQVVHPRDIVISPENTLLLEEINPDRIRYEVTANGKVAHLLKSW
ncbi:MAG TPA: APC family permease [Ktedonobacteraceae bacterium]|nr:APC family permease [Ktedonobacteraceae bacterium]